MNYPLQPAIKKILASFKRYCSLKVISGGCHFENLCCYSTTRIREPSYLFILYIFQGRMLMVLTTKTDAIINRSCEELQHFKSQRKQNPSPWKKIHIVINKVMT